MTVVVADAEGTANITLCGMLYYTGDVTTGYV